MKNTINYDVCGVLDGKMQTRVQRKFARDLFPSFVSNYIDEFHINATITSQQELDDFKLFLQTIQPCMNKQ